MSDSHVDDLYALIDGIEVAMLTTRRPDGQLVSRAMPTHQPHPATFAKEAQLAQFVIAEIRPKVVAEFLAKLCEALLRAQTSGVIADADEGGVARVITIRDNEVAQQSAEILQAHPMRGRKHVVLCEGKQNRKKNRPAHQADESDQPRRNVFQIRSAIS